MFGLVFVPHTSAIEADTLAQIKQSVVRVPARNCENNAHNGSGFLYGSSNRVLTALHVIAGCSTFSVYHEKTGDTITARVFKTYRKADLAVLKLDTRIAAPTLTKATIQPSYNDRLLVLGYEANARTMDDTELRMTSGSNKLADMLNDKSINQLRSVGMPSVNLEILRFDGHLIPGISGGPILNQSGEVVGIADGGLESGTASISWGVPIKNYYHLMSGNERNISASASGGGTLTAAAVFSADTNISLGDNVVCGQFTFRKMRTRRLSQLIETSDSPMGISQLINAANMAGHFNIDPSFDIYIHQQSGGAFAIPSGWEVNTQGGHCRAYNQSGEVEVRLAGATVYGQMQAQQASLDFEAMLLDDHALLAQTDPAWTYQMPFARADGLLAMRKSATLFSPPMAPWQLPQFRAYMMETLLVRSDAFLGIAAYDYSMCRVDYFAPGCNPAQPVSRDYVHASLGAALSTFPCGRSDRQFAIDYARNNVQSWNNGYCG
jgi:hypothetical protein